MSATTPDSEEVTRLKKELVSAQQLSEMCAKRANDLNKVIRLLIAAGFITEEKVHEAEQLLESL